jgi:amino acid adenylation domain-containing protein
MHLLQLSKSQSVLLVAIHHIVADGWSMGVLVRELAVLYNAYAQSAGKKAAGDLLAPASLSELPVQYADYAVWQRAWLSGGELERQEAYWQAQLADVPPLLDLPLDHARPPVQRFRGAWVSETVAADLSGKLRELASGAGATLFMVLLAAFKVLVARHTGREDVVIGTPIAGRRRTELEGLIGFFLNTLVLRSDLRGNPEFSEVVARVKQTTLGAYDHQELPFEKLLELLQPTRSTAYTPVVQVMFNLHNEPGGSMNLEGLRVSPFSVDRGTAKFDLSVAVVENNSGLQVGFEYNTDLFERETVAGLLQHYCELLAVVAAKPQLRIADLPLSSASAVQLPLHSVAAEPWAAAAGQTLTGRFADMVARYPERPAVCTPSESWNYRELDERASSVAGLLTQQLAPGSRVGLLLGHDAKMVAGLLGVLKAGCAYVPLDREAPLGRILAILAEADVAAVLTTADCSTVLDGSPDKLPLIVEVPDWVAAEGPPLKHQLASACSPDDLAYILFTSGSTGKPKGVMQNHRNVLHHVRTYSNALRISAEDRLSLFSTYGFDASVMDIFGALLNGACLCPLDIRSHEHPGELLDLMGYTMATESANEHAGITVLHSTPTVFRFLMRHKVCRHDLSSVRLVVLGGEEARANDFALFKRHFAPPALFVNGLGPSESTLATQFFADHQTHLPGQIVPVGRAVSETDIVLLNEDGSRAGISGELAVRSCYVSVGYWQQPELTRERFIVDPTDDIPGRRLYRTGDRVRMLPDGQLVYLGRIDGQVKVRGHRIEPGEIEAQLAAITGVDRCVVVLRSDSIDGRHADLRLVAYVVLQDEDTAQSIDASLLRRNLRAVLPDYMVPQAIMLVDELPLLPNGKVARAALPAPDWTRDESQIYVQPRTETERQLAGIWADILGVPNVGIHDDFFELGGHSLMAAQLVARVTESLQVGLPLRRLFDTPTIAGIAEHVDALQWALHNQPELPGS